MKKTVWTFGLIAGAVLSVMMVATLPFSDRIGFDKLLVIGYTTMVAAFMLIFFGIRSYRDNNSGGTISFGRAFQVGILITVVASVCYVATWQLVYYKLAPDFMENYTEHTLGKERANGASPEEIARTTARLQEYEKMYGNPLLNPAVTFLEPLPVGLIMSLVSAGILRRRRRSSGVNAKSDAAGVGAVV
jgi:uncharacterized membrane protein